MTNAEVISIKDYLDMRLNEIEKARIQAYNTMEKRLEGMNEFRDAIRDQSSKFPTREELALTFKSLDSDIRILRDYKNTLEGKANQSSVNTAFAIATLSLLFAAISLVLRFI